MKAPYHFGLIFEKKCDLKSLSKNSHFKSWLLEDFGEIKGGKGAQNERFGITFGTILGDFWGSGGILKIELSRESELNPEGWRGSGFRQISMLFLRPHPEPPQRHP